MNILLLGNGFDLYHKLPTRYDNFLHTVDFLIKNYNQEMKTVAQVFGNEILHKEDSFISECYYQHSRAFEKVNLNAKDIEELITLAKDNYWFSYLKNIFDNTVGWIDLEKETSFVLDTFRKFFENEKITFRMDKLKLEQQYILNCFRFFFRSYLEASSSPIKAIKNEYIKEYPLGSKVAIINKEKIIDKLFEEFNGFAKILKNYLSCFIENSLDKILTTSVSKCKALYGTNYAITFNYTSTFEKFYKNEYGYIYHMHGNVNKKIILGVNPDETDNLETIDTSFVCFKKYFQRTQYNTDREYLNLLDELNKIRDLKSLIVMGHSLDETDKDIIIDIFNNMDKIAILYHDESSHKEYISNIVKIFGKEGLDNLKKEKSLEFVCVYSDLSELMKCRKNTSDYFL